MRAGGRGHRDPRDRNRSLRRRPDRACAGALRRALRRKNTRGFGARALSPPPQAGGVSRQALRGEGSVFQGARHRDPLPRQLARRLGRERALGEAFAQILRTPRSVPEAAWNRKRLRVADGRNRHGLRIRGGRRNRSEGPEEKVTLGPVMLDVAGLRVASEEKEILRHPSVGGVILFARNFESPRQLLALTAEIRALRRPEPLIAVAHEGGRVQRFQEGFTRIPPMRLLGERWDADPARARTLAEATGYVVRSEERRVGKE